MNLINWNNFSKNPNAFEMLDENIHLIDNWFYLSANPNAVHLLGKLDTEKIREQCQPFAQELCAFVLHPLRLIRFAQKACLDLEDYLDLI